MQGTSLHLLLFKRAQLQLVSSFWFSCSPEHSLHVCRWLEPGPTLAFARLEPHLALYPTGQDNKPLQLVGQAKFLN